MPHPLPPLPPRYPNPGHRPLPAQPATAQCSDSTHCLARLLLKMPQWLPGSLRVSGRVPGLRPAPAKPTGNWSVSSKSHSGPITPAHQPLQGCPIPCRQMVPICHRVARWLRNLRGSLTIQGCLGLPLPNSAGPDTSDPCVASLKDSP